MIIRMNTDQIKKIRDDAFETAARTVLECGETYGNSTMADLIAQEIRAMKNAPVNVISKGNKVK